MNQIVCCATKGLTVPAAQTTYSVLLGNTGQKLATTRQSMHAKIAKPDLIAKVVLTGRAARLVNTAFKPTWQHLVRATIALKVSMEIKLGRVNASSVLLGKPIIDRGSNQSNHVSTLRDALREKGSVKTLTLVSCV